MGSTTGGSNSGDPAVYPDAMSKDAWKTSAINYYEKFNHAGQMQQTDGTWVRGPNKSDLDIANERMAVLQDLNQHLSKTAEIYPNNAGNSFGGNWYLKYFMNVKDPHQRLPGYTTIDGSTGQEKDPDWKWTGTNSAERYSYNKFILVSVNVDGKIVSQRLITKDLRTQYGLHDKSWGEMLDPSTGKDAVYDYLGSVYEAAMSYYKDRGATEVSFVNSDGQVLTKADAMNSLFVNFVGNTINKPTGADSCLNNFFYFARSMFDPFNMSEIPISSLPSIIQVRGNLLKQDVLPAIDRAAFVQVRQKVGDKLGLQAWYLRSMGEGYHKTGMEEIAGGWNAFADYKYFEHGSFFGGNGTEGVPDRYLDGIRSFTLGAGYVPARNFLLEAFYTFGAKSTSQRDTLYGPEAFTLGDYTRIQVTYKF